MKKRLQMILLIVLAIIALVACGKSKKEPQETFVQPTREATKIPTLEPTSIPTITPTPTLEPTPTIDPETISGRGRSDSAREEPQYVGLEGYVVIGDSQSKKLEKTDQFINTPWLIATYDGTEVEHKTKVKVLEQTLLHMGYGSYVGSLKVKNIEDDKEYTINVNNFITKPYWTYDDLEKAVVEGYYIAEYNQNSIYKPVDRNNKNIELKEGIKILVIGTQIDSEYPIRAIVFKDWIYGYGGVDIYFNPEDLTIVY